MTTAAGRHAAPTLVRLFQHYERVANIEVDDWQCRNGRAVFTISADHPRARWLMESASTLEVSALVMDTEEIEWLLEQVSSGARRDVVWPHPDHAKSFYRVKLVARTQRLRETQPDDDYCRALFGVER